MLIPWIRHFDFQNISLWPHFVTPNNFSMQIVDKKRFQAGVENLVNLISSTMGPGGHNVMVASSEQSIVYRDGAQVIRSYVPDDQVERNAVFRLRDAGEASLRFAGDSTSTTAVFLGSLFLSVEKQIAESEAMGTQLSRRLITDRLIELLEKMEQFVTENAIKVLHKNGKVNRSLIEKVATVAANNNPEIGQVVTDLIMQIGRSGGVNIQYSKSGKFEYSVAPGYAFNGGLVSPAHLFPGERQAMVENPYFVLVNDTISDHLSLKPITDQFEAHSIKKEEGRFLVLVCSDLTGVALSSVVAREHSENGQKTGKVFPIIAIAPPKDVNVKQFFEELSAVTGAKVFSTESGSLLRNFNFKNDAGTATRMVSTMANTVIEVAENQKSFTGRVTVDQLVDRLEKERDAAQKEDAAGYQERINRLRGAIGTLYIPGDTQGAIFMNKEVAEDSFLACQNAIKFGVLPGCGRAMYDAYSAAAGSFGSGSLEYSVAGIAVYNAILATVEAVVKNAGGNRDVASQMLTAYDLADPGKCFVVDREFMQNVSDVCRAGQPTPKVRLFSSDNSNIKFVENFEQLLAPSLRDAVESGVLDSAGGIIAAIHNTRTEIALWVMTQNIITHA